MLLSQGRTEMAERELRNLLAREPDDSTAHALLSLCMLEDQSRYQNATDEAQRAVALAPDDSYPHFVLSIVMLRRNRSKEALSAIEQAIELDPYDEDLFGQLAHVYLNLRDWSSCLDAADSGLQINPEDTTCNNLRSLALERLGRSQDAVASAEQTLRNSPEDSYSHSALGWTLLSNGQHEKAQESFRESLRLDPDNDSAREGLIAAINSRSFVFRAVHRFHIWLSRMSHKYQFALIFGLWILMQVLQRVAAKVAWLEPFVPVILLAYLTFAILTWTNAAIFNTFLRFHPLGRHLLRRDQIWTSNLVASCLISAIVGSIYAFCFYGIFGMIVVAFYWLAMCVVVTIPFSMPTRKRAIGFAVAGAVIGLLPIYGLVQFYLGQPEAVFVKFIQHFAWGILGIQIAAGFMAVVADRD